MTNEYWQEEIETMSRPDLEKLQTERLKATITQAQNAPFYKQLFKEKGLSTECIKSLEDLKKFPFTTKDDLRSHYPFGFSAVPVLDATTGTPRSIASPTELGEFSKEDAHTKV